LTYCTNCFSNVFESTFNLNNGKGPRNPPKVKPPPPPTKPSKDKKLGESIERIPGAPFQCKICQTSLHGKTVESLAGEVYCRECYEDRIKKLRCSGCYEAFTKDNVMVLYSNKPWHHSCFRCAKCQQPIGSKSFTREEDDSVYCEDCYFQKSGKQCAKCKKMFSTSGVWFRNEHYHKECFNCAFCALQLGDKEVFVHQDRIVCGNCYDEQFLKKCTKCLKPMLGEIIEYEGQPYHVDCFICSTCLNPLGESSFIPREGKVFCENCFCMEFGKICKKCGLTVSPTHGHGLVYRGEHYHSDCFVCTHCSQSLSGQLVHTQKNEDVPYCGPCYDELFSKRCTACKNIISGVVGSKYISHEGRHWHEECFNCHNCESSLANRKVAVDHENNLTCAPCLMTRNLKGN